jgi:hypothetical protein
VGIFRRRPDLSRLPTNLDVDPTCGDPDLVTLRSAMRARDWPGVTAVLDRAADHDELTYFVTFAAGSTGSEEWLADVLAEVLESTTALLLQGARHIVWAWEARGRKLARDTGRDQFTLFFERLRVAEDCLQSVVRRDPANATAWCEMIITARGLQLGLSEAQSRFERAVRAQPGHRRAHLALQQNLCPKWVGSVDELREFVASSTAQAADGSHLWVLVPVMHFELAANLDDPKKRLEYFRSREVRDALRGAAARSVNHRDFRRERDWADVANWFAAMFAVNQDWKSAAPLFRMIDRWVTASPWNHFSEDPGRIFVGTRNRAYLKE